MDEDEDDEPLDDMDSFSPAFHPSWHVRSSLSIALLGANLL